jgi:hypothetical protein
METLITISNFLILGLIIFSPILILIILKKLKIKRTLIIYSLISLLVLGALIRIFAWWADKSDMIILEHYGYNNYGWTETERFQNVAQENFEKVKSLEANSMGIGWPLKAIFGFVMTVPYLIIVYLGKKIISKFNNYKNET